LAILTGLAVTLSIGVAPAQAQSTPVTACGQVLDAPGQYHLTGDLGPCPGNGVVIAASNVHFTLAGFALSGTAKANGCDFEKAGIGVLVQASGLPLSSVRVSGGTVTGFFGGVVLEASNSRVSAMTLADSCLYGILVSGNRNLVDTNVVTGSDFAGVALVEASRATVRSNHVSANASCGLFINGSDRNKIRSNILENNGGGGVCAESGDGNSIVGNAADGNGDGISVGAVTGTLVRDNTANRNRGMGIAIGAGGSTSTVTGNTARSNDIVDLSDANADCDANVWKQNTFGSDSVAGVSDGGPGTGCIR